MHVAWLALALQLRGTAMAVPPAVRPGADAADSARDARRARNEQASFERARRAALPWENGSGGRCDVRLGRFCWWYDDYTPELPPEPESIVRRRDELVALFDSLYQRQPGDDWLAGMRVHYRIEARRLASADSAARDCHATGWWCGALAGYAAHVQGDAARALRGPPVRRARRGRAAVLAARSPPALGRRERMAQRVLRSARAEQDRRAIDHAADGELGSGRGGAPAPVRMARLVGPRAVHERYGVSRLLDHRSRSLSQLRFRSA
jgi:hypothetical protein